MFYLSGLASNTTSSTSPPFQESSSKLIYIERTIFLLDNVFFTMLLVLVFKVQTFYLLNSIQLKNLDQISSLLFKLVFLMDSSINQIKNHIYKFNKSYHPLLWCKVLQDVHYHFLTTCMYVLLYKVSCSYRFYSQNRIHYITLKSHIETPTLFYKITHYIQ
jgi:hypothetical protein